MTVYQKVSRYRSLIMGLAILWIVLFHSGFHLPFSPFQLLKTTGYGGTDFFMFCSGFGIYCSLNHDFRFSTFWKKRAKRIFPSYFLVITAWVIMETMLYGMSLSEILGNYLFFGSWAGFSHQFNWYVPCILVFYLLSPLFYRVLQHARERLVWILVLLLVPVGLSFLFFHSGLLISVSRLPIYLTGMVFAQKMLSGKDLTLPKRLVLYGAALCGMLALFFWIRNLPDLLWEYGLWWYPFILIVPGMSIAAATLAARLQKYRAVHKLIKGISVLGNSSLEIYLVHIALFDLCKYYKIENAAWALAILFAVTAGILLHLLMERIVRDCSKKLCRTN